MNALPPLRRLRTYFSTSPTPIRSFFAVPLVMDTTVLVGQAANDLLLAATVAVAERHREQIPQEIIDCGGLIAEQSPVGSHLRGYAKFAFGGCPADRIICGLGANRAPPRVC